MSYNAREVLNVAGALGWAQDGRYVFPVSYDAGLDAYVPRAFPGDGDTGIRVSRAREQVTTWAELYPYDRFVAVPMPELHLYDFDPSELFEDGRLDQATLDEVAYRRRKAEQSADRRIASENYTGTREVAWADFLAQPEAEWLVDGLIGRGSLNYLVARANLGKSFTYVDMALCMATGRDWHGVATDGERVMLVIGEGFSQFHKRIRAWCEHYDVDPLTLADRFVVFDGANLNNDESLGILSARAGEFQPDLIVFDTWAQTSGLSDEDKAALSSATLSAARSVAPDAALLFVAHPTKSSEDTAHPILRGSSATFGAADNVLTMFVDSGYQTGLDRKYLAISTESEHGGKSRDAEQVTMRGFYLASADPSAVLMRDDAEALSKSDQFAFKWLEVGVPATAQEVAERAGVTVRTVQRHLGASKAVTVTKGKSTSPDHYTLTAERKTTRTVNVTDDALRFAA